MSVTQMPFSTKKPGQKLQQNGGIVLSVVGGIPDFAIAAAAAVLVALPLGGLRQQPEHTEQEWMLIF